MTVFEVAAGARCQVAGHTEALIEQRALPLGLSLNVRSLRVHITPHVRNLLVNGHSFGGCYFVHSHNEQVTHQGYTCIQIFRFCYRAS